MIHTETYLVPMEDVPDAPDFQPAGLPTAVVRGGSWKNTTRMDFLTPVPFDKEIVFAIHTVSVAEGKTYAVPQSLYDDMAVIDRAGLSEHIREMDETADVEKSSITNTEDYAAVETPDVTVYVTGHLLDGRKFGVVTSFRPFCEVELPDTRDEAGLRRWFENDVLGALCFSLGRLHRSRVTVSFRRAPRFYGYVPESVTNPKTRKQFLFARVHFPNTNLMRRGASNLRADYGRPLRLRGQQTAPAFRVYEDGIDTIQKFIDSYGLVPSAWHVYSPGSRILPRQTREMLVDIEVEMSSTDQRQLVYLGKESKSGYPDPTCVPPLLMAVIDCEMNSGSASRMPVASFLANPVVVVSVVYAFCGQVPEKLAATTAEYQEFERHAYVLSDVCEEIPGVIVHLYNDEFEMLAAIRDDMFVHKKVDIVSGHNVIRFDMEYMASRIHLFGPDAAKRFMRFGVLLMESLSIHAGDLSSSAFGSNRLSKLDGAGFVYVDTLLLCKTGHKLRQNTLKYAAEYFNLETSKFDMPYDLIPVVAAGADPVHWRKLTAYCVQDSLLVLKLIKKWDSIKDLVAQSRIMNIPFDTNVQAGQMERVRDYVMRDAHGPDFKMVMNGVNVRGGKRMEGVGHTSAIGGYVLDNIQGLHDKPICVLDFASLYPSVQDAKNLCWSTVAEDGVVTDEHIANGLEVETFVTATGTFRFVTNVPGVFPKSLRALRFERNQYKAAMKRHAYGTPGYQNADNAQKAIKIPMNSGYGTANCPRSKGGKMECIPMGTVTCHVGRQLNQLADEFCKKNFGTETIYGDTDSIMVYFPEPEEILRGTRLERLKYAMAMGERAEVELNTFLNGKLNTDAVKTEFEKCYFPFLSVGKKTYAGLKFEPGDEAKADADLQVGGRIECKGIRTVRRDVPQFVSAMTDRMLQLLFFARNEDGFWDTVHTYAEKLCRHELPMDSLILTAELKSGYGDKASLTSQAAVSYAREYAVRGSGFQDGDRVPFVYVEETDDQRTVRPPWLDADIARVHAVAEKKLDVEDEDDMAYCYDDDGPSSCGMEGGPRFVPVGGTSVDDKKCKHARHPSEVHANPDHNHIDVEKYMDDICTVLSQLMPQAVRERDELKAFAKAYKAYNQRVRSVTSGSVMGGDRSVEAMESSLPRLSHRRPIACITMTHTLHGSTVSSFAEKVVKKKASRKAPTLAEGNVGKKQRSLRD